ncbi:sporulation integral membrane protein YlbJ [Paenibacillus sp. GCM10012307]|uniref:Sporulation integral membrane protein YlbJ n=1 Tax=Paenibacillus roseus TaxID=2798579 RepID=A0A934J6S0_9BACL|nr:sporulation integral membrane protein YlbJ [Paenibacillus roseus]MBJ6361415.1 sporulation integral membrane protein YlbJ [Paenibacillus roseus]
MLRYLIHPVVLVASTALVLALLLAVFPESSMTAAIRGISIWWEVLFPALFPFFVISEVLLGFGIVHFFGTLLDPMMRPVFRVPGIGGFVMTMGFVAGYPVGARLSAQLYDQKLINRTEGERLVALTTSSDPIFLIGAVAVGFFHNAALVPVLVVAHYGGSVLIGLLMRFYDRGAPATPVDVRKKADQSNNRLAAAFMAMHKARLMDARPLGKLLSDAIAAALRLMMVVGGLVVFFSVVMEVLTSAGAISVITSMVDALFRLFGLPASLSPAIVNGLFEVTLGVKAAGSTTGSQLVHQAAAAAWVLSWGGLSVHAQVVSLLSRTGMRYKPFLIARLIHGAIAMLLVYLLWGWLGPGI